MLCVLALFFGCFSLTANAEDNDKKVYTKGSILSLDGTTLLTIDKLISPNNGTVDRGTIEGDITYDFTGIKLSSYVSVANQNGSAIVQGGYQTKVTLENAYITLLATHPNDNTIMKYFYHNKSNTTVSALITFTDGTTTILRDNVTYTLKNNGIYDMSVVFTPDKPVRSVRFNLSTTFTPEDFIGYSVSVSSGDSLTGYKTHFTINLGEYTDTNNFITVEQETKDTTLLGGILDWTKSIGDTIGKLFDSVTNGFNNIINGIIELPNKLWSAIENGLKSLFVPDEDYIVDYKSRWEQLLEEKLGAVYQVINLTFESWDRIIASDTTNTITIPNVSIPLGDSSFSFGGQDVPIVPDGFDWLATTIKTFTGGLCTLLFVNGLRKRYDEVMGGGQ